MFQFTVAVLLNLFIFCHTGYFLQKFKLLIIVDDKFASTNYHISEYHTLLHKQKAYFNFIQKLEQEKQQKREVYKSTVPNVNKCLGFAVVVGILLSRKLLFHW